MRSLVASAALVAPLLAAQAAPQSAHEPILPPAGERGLFGTVADKVASGGTELLSQGGQIVTHVRDGATNLVDSAMNFLGVRYKLGGTSAETGFDCSGFTRYVFENSIGHILPHRANEQANDPNLAKVDRKDLKPGDLVFFDTMRRTFSHVGIYLGDGKFIHAPRTGESVRIEDINISYWARRFTGARRVPELANADGANSTDGLLSRLRERLFRGGPDALLDHELVEYLLALAIPRRDTKPLAKALLHEFGGIAGLLTADAEALARVPGMGETSAAALKAAHAAALRLLRSQVAERPVLANWQALLDYLRADMAHHAIERVRVLHLNSKNMLIRDELMNEGSIDEAPVYVREVIRRAIDLKSASIILVHNHPTH